MPVGRHRFEFVGEEPLIFRILATVTIANGLMGLALPYALRYLKPEGFPNSLACEALASKGVQYRVPEAVCWYASRWIMVEFVLIAMIAVVLLALRKRVRHIDLG